MYVQKIVNKDIGESLHSTEPMPGLSYAVRQAEVYKV